MSPDGETVQKAMRAEIVRKDDSERVITGPVLIPDREDRHGDVVRKDNIQEVAYQFLEEYQNIDLMHTFEEVGVPVESYLAPEDLSFAKMDVPEGTWMVSVRVKDDEVWQAVQEGELTGFSIYGQGRRTEAEA